MSFSETISIIPYCIYHYLDTNTNTFMGYLGGSELIVNDKGEKYYNCLQIDKIYNGWYYSGTFYAINPTPSGPIPTGMKLFAAKRNKSNPFNTIDISLVYDPFDISDDC